MRSLWFHRKVLSCTAQNHPSNLRKERESNKKNTMTKETKLYKPSGKNAYRDERYRHISQTNRLNKSIKYGQTKNGNSYFHLLEYNEKDATNLLDDVFILNEVNTRFQSKAGDKKRVLTNMLASQACCFNLFAPLKKEENKNLRNDLFSKLLKKKVTVSSIEIEFTPTIEESIGDQSTFRGTDSDLAVSYETEQGKKGIILMEFKYIEDKFSVCSSYRTKNGKLKDGVEKVNIRPTCNNPGFLDNHLKSDKNDCGYKRFENWDLTKNSKVLNYEAIKNAPSCPFRFSLNQLWRNMLLAEKTAMINKMDEFHFWVLSPNKNTKLWNNHSEDIYSEFSKILTDQGKLAFRKLDIEEDFINTLESSIKDKNNKHWMQKFRDKYIAC